MQIKRFNYRDMIDHVSINKVLFNKLYITENMTAREVAANQNIFYDQNIQKALYRVCGSKGNGLGGVRVGSGNKKGRFCGKCKSLKPCAC